MHLEVLIKITIYQRKLFSKKKYMSLSILSAFAKLNRFTQIKTLKAFRNIIQKHFDVLNC